MFAAQTAQRSQPPSPGHALPSPSAFLLTHPQQEGSHPGLGPPGSAMEIYRVPPPPSSPIVGKNSCHGSCTHGMYHLACTIWPGAKHLITGLLPGVSQAGTTIQCLALVFPIDPGEGHPTENNNTSGLLCCMPSAPLAQHKPSLLALGLSSSILPWGSSPVLSMPGPLSPHLLLSWQ